MHAAMEVIQLPHQIQLIPLLALLSSFVTPWVVVLASSFVLSVGGSLCGGLADVFVGGLGRNPN